MKIDVNLLEREEKSEETSREKKSQDVTESSEDSTRKPEETEGKTEVSEPVKEESGEEVKTSGTGAEDKTAGETVPVSEKPKKPSREKKKKAGGKGGNGEGNGKKTPLQRGIFLFIVFIILVMIGIMLWKPEFVPGFFKPAEDTVLVVTPLEEEEVTEKPEFSIVPAEDEKASDTLKRIREAINGTEHPIPENLQNLKNEVAESRERLKRFFILSGYFPNGLFWSYYSASSGYELLEMKANKVGLFEKYFNRVMDKKLFDSLNFYSYDGKYWNSLEGVFAGTYTSSGKTKIESLYSMSSDDFLDYVGYAAQKAGINFTDRISHEVEAGIPESHQKVFKLTFYGTVSKLSEFADGLLEIPATFTINKVIAGRRPSDTYPDPLKLTLFVSLFEKD